MDRRVRAPRQPADGAGARMKERPLPRPWREQEAASQLALLSFPRWSKWQDVRSYRQGNPGPNPGRGTEISGAETVGAVRPLISTLGLAP